MTIARCTLYLNALLAGVAAASLAHGGEPYPTRPIRMIVPFSPGGTSDTMARILGQKMTESWGQPVVVDMRPGASGAIGTEIAARAAADGHSLLHANLSLFATNPFLYAKLGYSAADFAPLSSLPLHRNCWCCIRACRRRRCGICYRWRKRSPAR